MKKNKYDHVGRPTNEEVRARKNNKLLKLGCGATLILVAVFGMFFSINKLDLSLLKGSSTSDYMKKVQTNSKIKKARFRPDTSNRYYFISNTYKVKNKDINTTRFSNYLFYYAGFSKSYTSKKIEIYNDGKLVGSASPNNSFGVKRELVGKTLALRLTASKNGKNYYKYLRLYVPSELRKAPTCRVSFKEYRIKGFREPDCARLNLEDSFNRPYKNQQMYIVEFLVYYVYCDSHGEGFKNHLSKDVLYGTNLFSYCAPKAYSKDPSTGKKMKKGEFYIGALAFDREYETKLTNNLPASGKEHSLKFRPFSLKNKKGINAIPIPNGVSEDFKITLFDWDEEFKVYIDKAINAKY